MRIIYRNECKDDLERKRFKELLESYNLSLQNWGVNRDESEHGLGEESDLAFKDVFRQLPHFSNEKKREIKNSVVQFMSRQSGTYNPRDVFFLVWSHVALTT